MVKLSLIPFVPPFSLLWILCWRSNFDMQGLLKDLLSKLRPNLATRMFPLYIGLS
jgi:hypothetical protein